MPELDLKVLNESIIKDKEDLILKSEMDFLKMVDAIAEKIESDGRIKIVLLAGPSGSGKTTSANMICDRLRSDGKGASVVSLDDFYRESHDPEYPRLANGKRDFETVDALDIPLLQKTLQSIADGEAYSIPKYDFKCGGRSDVRSFPPIGEGIVIIEGLHALNPVIFSLLPPEKLLKIFISVSTNITNRGAIILSGRKIRFLRRMVRDSIYRGAEAELTLSMWAGVLKGEDKYLYPNRKNADISFDTFHPFELGVMRSFAEKLISRELAAKNPYAKTVLSAVSKVEKIPLSLVPESSLIREFVPGGIYEDLY